MESTEDSSLSTDSKLSDVLKRHPDFWDRLALCLDRNTRLIRNWKQLARELDVDEDFIKTVEEYRDQSPTIQLFQYLEVTQPQLTIQQLGNAMLDIQRNDLFSLLTTEGRFVGSERVREVMTSKSRSPSASLLDEIAQALDVMSPVLKNWYHLAIQLGVPKEDCWNLERRSTQSPTNGLFQYLEATRPQMTLKKLKEILHELGRRDLLYYLDKQSLEDGACLKDVMTPGSELLQTMANKLDGKSRVMSNWYHLADKLEVPVAIRKGFDRVGQKGKSPLKEGMQWLVARFPDMTLKDVVKALERIQRNDAIQIITSQFPDTVDLLVPQEIQTQGHRAEAAFREAMEKGSVEVYRGRIMLIGQDRAGKTSLKKFLLDIPFDPKEDSTVGIEVDRTKFEVGIDQVKNWQCTDHKKLDLSEYRDDIAKITAERMKAVEGESQETTGSMDLHDVNVLPKIEEDAEGFEESDSNQGSKAEIDPSTSNVQQNDVPANEDVQLVIDTSAGLTLDDVTEKVEQCLQGLELNDDVKAKEVILSVWDFAGQNLYYASHSVFFSHRAVYVLVHNLSKDLSAQAKPCTEDETGKIELENPTNQTNLDNLLSWLVSVHCIRPTRDEASESSEAREEKEEKCPPYLRPPVFVVGTRADKPFKDIGDTLQYIQDSISGKRYDEHVIRPLYAVDNTRSVSGYGVQALQNRISEVLKQEPYMGEKVPIRWFHFEKVVEALVADEIYHMELNELLKYTKRYCHIDKEDELKTMLQFYHDLGVIVKHGRTVVLQALWLIDLFKKLINVRPYDERDPRYSGCWQELKEKGILRMDLVDRVFTDIIRKHLSKQDILKMMENHGLIAKFSFLPADGDHQQEYFVPSLLKSLPLDLYEIKPSNCDPCPLYLHFPDGFVPHGLFAQLVSRCIVWCSGCCPEIPELYQNGAMFFFIGKQRIFDLVLICRKRFIKIILTRNSQASAPSTIYSATKAREVRVFLEGTLKDMTEELSWLRNLRYELCVACTHCLKSPDQCSRHSSVRCADDDCLNLLPLRPEEQLICRKNYARKPIKIYGLEKWLLIHEKESEERKKVFGNPKDAVKEGSPEKNDLERLANRLLRKEWKKLGRRLLESDEALLDAVDEDNDTCSEKAYKMLLKWKAAKGSDATIRVLHDALCHDLVNRRDLAEEFCLVTDD